MLLCSELRREAARLPDPRSGGRVAIRLDSQNGVLIILTVIFAHVAFLAVVLPPEGLGDPLTPANVRPESWA